MPLAGKCIQRSSGISSGPRFASSDDGVATCGGNVVLTVSEGAVRKYIQVTKEVMESYGVDDYTKQRVGWMSDSVDSLFNNDRVTVMTLEDFL
jgi:DNA polymerase II large subunit